MPRNSVDVRDGNSIWLPNEVPAPIQQKLSQNLECDILIVGAGISGAIICDELTKQNRRPVLIDSRSAGEGSTASSTAILSFELDSHLTDLCDRLGELRGRAIYQTCFSALTSLRTRLQSAKNYRIPLQNLPSLYLASIRNDERRLRRECEQRAALGLTCTFVSPSELFDRYRINAFGATRTEFCSVVDPVAATRTLISDCIARGAEFYATSRVVSYEARNNGVVVQLGDKRTISARKVILAMGYETKEWMRFAKGSLITSYVGVTQRIDMKSIWGEALVLWESERPYTYLRPTFDGRLMVGGADRQTRWTWLRSFLAPNSLLRLKEKAEWYLPEIDLEFTQAWWGMFGESEDGLPMLGTDEANQNIFFVYACGGNGIVFSEIASAMISDWLDGRRHPLSAVMSLKERCAPQGVSFSGMLH